MHAKVPRQEIKNSHCVCIEVAQVCFHVLAVCSASLNKSLKFKMITKKHEQNPRKKINRAMGKPHFTNKFC